MDEDTNDHKIGSTGKSLSPKHAIRGRLKPFSTKVEEFFQALFSGNITKTCMKYTQKRTAKSVNRLSVIIVFPSFWPFGFAALKLHSFKREETSIGCGVPGLFADLFVSSTCKFPLYPFYSILPPLPFPFLFSSFTLDISKGHPENLCSQ